MIYLTETVIQHSNLFVYGQSHSNLFKEKKTQRETSIINYHGYVFFSNNETDAATYRLLPIGEMFPIENKRGFPRKEDYKCMFSNQNDKFICSL